MNALVEYVGQSGDTIMESLSDHVVMSVVPVVLALACSLPLGWWAARRPVRTSVLLSMGGVAYSVPSIALFIVLPLVFGYQILSLTNIIVALTIYSTALLVRNVIDGLEAVPEDVRLSATAVGYGRLGRLLSVELPVAVPVITAGLRVVTVTNVSMVSVGALIGIGGLGDLFVVGLRSDDSRPIVVGLVLSVLLALTLDALLVLGQRWLTPWVRVRAAR
ncbi:MAG: ABC transporter permease subunit [Actinomycetota bacterium]|nr:ABC transporter permease subunit [Actinomycetota bacterium]